MLEPPGSWHHSPSHVFHPDMIYFVTAGTYNKEHFFRSPERLALLQESLFHNLSSHGWRLLAWAILSNHYHFIAESPGDARSLKVMLQSFHSWTSKQLNRMDAAPGRKVWFQYWDTCLTYERSFFARLNYVNNNPVKHGVVATAEQYPYCSMGWSRSFAEPAYRRKVESFPYDRVHVEDRF